VKPIIFYRLHENTAAKGVSYRFFFDDKYVIFAPMTGHVSHVLFSDAHRERDRTQALDMFREDDSGWMELK